MSIEKVHQVPVSVGHVQPGKPQIWTRKKETWNEHHTENSADHAELYDSGTFEIEPFD